MEALFFLIHFLLFLYQTYRLLIEISEFLNCFPFSFGHARTYAWKTGNQNFPLKFYYLFSCSNIFIIWLSNLHTKWCIEASTSKINEVMKLTILVVLYNNMLLEHIQANKVKEHKLVSFWLNQNWSHRALSIYSIDSAKIQKFLFLFFWS
jgi:hypothetical protein